MLLRAIERATRGIRQRLSAMIARGEMAALTDGAVQTIQVELLAGEIRDFVQRFQQYGLNSVPLPGAYPVLVVCPFGDRAQAVSVAVDDVRHRPQDWAPGDSGLYDSRGNVVRLRDDRIEITTAAGAKLSVTAGTDVEIDASGDVSITLSGGTATIQGASVANIDAATVNLAGGGPAVARVGDAVAGGVITGGSSKVFAG